VRAEKVVFSMDTLLQDIRYGLRLLRKTPAFSVAIMLIVATGVGAGATIFSVVESSLLWNQNPNVDRWVMMRAFFPHRNMRVFSFSSGEYLDFAGLTDVFERVGAVHGINATLFVDRTPQVVEETLVTSDMMPMTATPPLLGRIFSEDDDKPGNPKTTVLTYELWQHAFGGDRKVLGRAIRIDDDHYTVIGVMPPRYNLWGGSVFVPFQLDRASADRTDRRMRVVGLLRRGVSVEQAHARLADFARTMAREHADTNPEYNGMQVSTWNIKEAVIGGVRPVLLILLAAVGFVIVISCANIGNLLLARASGRRREIVVRAALGASQFRIVRQLITESVLLSLMGGGLGVLFAAWGVPAVVALAGESQLPNAGDARLDAGALALAIGVSAVMGIVFGLAPALYTVRDDLAHAVREGGLQAGGSRRERWTRAALVISQVTLAMVVLAGAGLMIRSYRELMRLDVGYDTHDALTMQLALPMDKYPRAEMITAFYRELVERLRAANGIDGAAVATGRPLMDRIVDVSTQDFYLSNALGAASVPNADVRVVSPGYFGVAGMRLIRGRLLEDGDTSLTETVAVINQTMAKLFWPGKEAVGEHLRLATLYGNGAGITSAAARDAAAHSWVRIVGVVSDARQVNVAEVPVRQELFFPVAQRPEMSRAVTLIVRSRLPTNQATATVRRAVAAVDADRPIFEVITLEQAVANSLATARLATVLLAVFACVAIALAGIGLYAVVAYSVSRLTRDIGIRIALGATPRDVLRLTMGDGWRMTFAGLTLGIAAALMLTRLMRGLVFDVSTSDPLTFAAAAALLASLATLASYLPARRATRIDPARALRAE
jgi:putative ABC transport system permease protein